LRLLSHQSIMVLW